MLPLRRMRSLSLAVAACAALGCAHPPVETVVTGPAVGDSATVRPQVEAAMRRFNRFMRVGPPDSVAAMFTANGELYEPRNPVHTGRASIRDFFAPLTVDVRIESAATTTQALELFGKSVLQWGEYVDNGGEVSRPTASYRGRFVAEWMRQADGRWLLRRLMLQPLTNR